MNSNKIKYLFSLALAVGPLFLWAAKPADQSATVDGTDTRALHNCSQVIVNEKKIPACTDLSPLGEGCKVTDENFLKKGARWQDEDQYLTEARDTYSKDKAICIEKFTHVVTADPGACCGG